MEIGKTAPINFDGSEEENLPSQFSSETHSSLSLDRNQSHAATEAESGQASNVEEASVNDLPPEMWMEILKCVDTRSLFNCRLVNFQFNEISTGILTTRSDAKITFTFEQKHFFQKRGNTNQESSLSREKTSLKNFLLCMKKSKNSAFVRFAFFCEEEDSDSVFLDFFGHEDWKVFLAAVDESHKTTNQNQNQRIKIKSLELKFNDVSEPFEPFMEHLRDLLLKKIPYLQELGLNFMYGWEEQETETRLFPEAVKKTMVQLAHLKTIHFHQGMISGCPGMVKDLLSAAVNLNKIYLYETHCHFYSNESYNFLQPLKKFHLLKSYEFQIDDGFLTKVKKRPNFTSALFKLELEELRIDMDCLNEAEVARATNFLSSLFESKKNSLKKLTTAPLGIFQRLQFPTFKNLTELIIKEPDDPENIFYFPGVRALDIFPAVRKLDLSRWILCGAFPDLDSIPIFPRVENLSVDDVAFTADCVRVLPLLCPNLKHLKIHQNGTYTYISSPAWDFLPIGRALWTDMQQLESLEIDILVGSRDNGSLDSCFTGISLENIQRLQKMMEAKKRMGKGGSQAQISESESELIAIREHPSILDMTNLKTLKINPFLRNRIPDRRDFFTEKLTWISEEFAFKFLPHLKPKLNPKPPE